MTLICSFYKNTFGYKENDIELSVILRGIREGSFQKEISSLRKTLITEGKPVYQKNKTNLRAFTPSVICSINEKDGRTAPPNKSSIIKYNKIVILDIDNLIYTDVEEVREKANSLEYTLASFVSPSAKGLKILVKVSSIIDQHKQAYDTVSKYYEQHLKVDIDKAGSHPNVLCYVSYDPFLFYNEKSKIFPIQGNIFQADNSPLPTLSSFEKAIGRVPIDFVKGQRNNFRKLLAVECVKFGIPQQETLSFFLDNFLGPDESDKKAVDIVTWAYANVKEFGIYKDWTNQNRPQKKTSQEKQNFQQKKHIVNALYREEKTENQHSRVDFSKVKTEGIKDEKLSKAIKKQRLIEYQLSKQYDFRYNEMIQGFEYKSKQNKFWSKLEEHDVNSIKRKLLSLGVSTTKALIGETIKSDFSPRENPLKKYFQEAGNAYGEGHIAQLAKSLVLKNQNAEVYKTDLIKKWLVASVANVFVTNGCTNHLVLVLSGKQGCGKTSWLTMLMPLKIKEYTFSGRIDPRNKESMGQLAENFILNIEEQLVSLTKEEDVEALKALVTLNFVKMRGVWKHNADRRQRIANFCGSIDRKGFLTDERGNRRFLPFELKKIDWTLRNKIDIDAVWGEAFRLYKAGYQYTLSNVEESFLDEYREDFKALDYEHELILRFFGKGTELDHDEHLPSGEIAEKIKKNVPSASSLTPNKITKALAFLGYNKKRIQTNGTRINGWFLKLLNE